MADDVYTPEEQSFLDELTELSRKHGIIVDGCGCCGSPNLRKLGEFDKTEMEKPGCYGRKGMCYFEWCVEEYDGRV